MQFTIPAMQYYAAIVRLGLPPIITLLLLYIPKMLAMRQQLVVRKAAILMGIQAAPYNDGIDSGSASSSGNYAVGDMSRVSGGITDSPGVHNHRRSSARVAPDIYPAANANEVIASSLPVSA